MQVTVTDTSTENAKTPPPPPPATISFEGEFGKNPLADAGFGAMCRRLPSVLVSVPVRPSALTPSRLQGRAADSVAGEAVAERLPTAGARMIATAVKARTTIMATRSP